jgi:lipopolysaccharide assembly outer membrane protein LptD (OstA)
MAAFPVINKLALAAVPIVLGTLLSVSGAARAADPTRCTEDVVIDSDNFDGDYKKNDIQLKNVVISQCDIRVQAKSARANGLNIESARWTFEGDVRIDVENRGNLRANHANVEFKDSQIAKLTIVGTTWHAGMRRKSSMT